MRKKHKAILADCRHFNFQEFWFGRKTMAFQSISFASNMTFWHYSYVIFIVYSSKFHLEVLCFSSFHFYSFYHNFKIGKRSIFLLLSFHLKWHVMCRNFCALLFAVIKCIYFIDFFLCWYRFRNRDFVCMFKDVWNVTLIEKEYAIFPSLNVDFIKWHRSVSFLFCKQIYLTLKDAFLMPVPTEVISMCSIETICA